MEEYHGVWRSLRIASEKLPDLPMSYPIAVSRINWVRKVFREDENQITKRWANIKKLNTEAKQLTLDRMV